MKLKFTLFSLAATVSAMAQLTSASTIGPTHKAVQFIDSQNGFTIAFSEPDGSLPNGLLRKTFDGGDTWVSYPITFTPSLPEFSGVNSIIINDKLQMLDANTGFCAGILNSTDSNQAMLLKTTDGGSTWTGYPFINGLTIESVFFVNATTGFIGTFQKLYKTTDSGASWAVVLEPPAFGGTFTAVHFINPEIGFARGGSKFYKTTDGGLTWNEKSLGTGNTTHNVTSITFKSGQLGFITSSNGKIIATTDAGENWNTIYQGEGSDRLSSLSIINNKIIVGGYDSNAASTCNTFLVTSTDNGATWLKECFNFPISVPRWVYSVAFITETKGFLGVDGGMYKYDTTPLNTSLHTVENFMVYPNPTKDVLNIISAGAYSNLNYDIYDSSSRIISTGFTVTANNIDLSNLASGIYLIHFKGINKTYKIVKE